MLRFLYITILFISSLIAVSQSLTYKNYNVNQGLPSSQIYDIIQDKNKYIWIATDRGVSKFDGYTFTNYTSENGLLDNTIFSIYEDQFGRIWFLSYCGKLSYYYRNKIYSYKYNHLIQPSPKVTPSVIRSLCILPDSSLIIGTVGTGAIKISNTGVIRDLTNYSDLCKYHFVLQKSDDLYYSYLVSNPATKPYLAEHDLSLRIDGNTIFTFSIQKKRRNIFHLIRKNKHIVIAAGGTMVDIKDNKVADSLNFTNSIISLYEDSDSCLWVGYIDGGLKKFPPNKSFTDKDFKLYFQQNQVTKVLEDYEHGFWFTTLENGLIYVPNIQIENLESEANILTEEKNVSIATDYISRVFLGTSKGHVKTFRGAKPDKSSNLPEVSTKGFVRTLYYDSLLKTLYISNYGNTFSYHNKQLKEILSTGILSFQRKKDGMLLGGNYVGIFNNFPKESRPNIRCKTEVVRVESMCEYKNKLWLGSYNGLYYLDKNSIAKKEGDSLLNYRITSMISNRKNLYIGTLEKGIIIWNGRTTELFSVKNGLKSNIINSMQLENDSILWIATSKGACKINLYKKKVLFTLTVNKGLCSNEVKDICLLNDTVYLLTYEGVSFFKSNQVFKNSTPPAIHIQDFRVDTVSYIKESNPVLNHSRNYITFNVTGLNFKQAGNVKYTYRLKGYSEQWRKTSSNNIQLAFVPPGTYTFEVMAENEDGILSERPDTFRFTISQPLWNRSWFQLLIVLSMVTILVFILLVRIKRIKEKNKIMEQLAGFKQQALTMQMNPHFIFNLLSSIQSYILSEDSVKASKHIAMFAKLMRTNLHNSRKEFIAFEEEINTLKLYVELESIRIKNKILFSIVYDSVLMHNIMIPPMLIQPHIENALKHAFHGSAGDKQEEIRVSFTFSNKLLSCCVEDNGVGLNKARELKQENTEHLSAGIEVTKTRLELLCKNLDFPYSFIINDSNDLDKNNTGTIVKFIIPYIYDTKSSDS